VDECKPLEEGTFRGRSADFFYMLLFGRVLDSSTFQLNVSTFCPMWCGALLVSFTKTAQVEQRCGQV